MDGFIAQILTLLAYHLPELLACIVGMVMLSMRTSASPGRMLAASGMLLLLGSAVLRLALSLTQAWMIHDARNVYDSVSGILAVFGAASMLLAVASAVGLVLLVWGASRAMRRDQAPASAWSADEPT